MVSVWSAETGEWRPSQSLLPLTSIHHDVPLPPGSAGRESGVRHEALAGGRHYRGRDEEKSPFPVLILPVKPKIIF